MNIIFFKDILKCEYTVCNLKFESRSDSLLWDQSPVVPDIMTLISYMLQISTVNKEQVITPKPDFEDSYVRWIHIFLTILAESETQMPTVYCK